MGVTSQLVHMGSSRPAAICKLPTFGNQRLAIDRSAPHDAVDGFIVQIDNPVAHAHMPFSAK